MNFFNKQFWQQLFIHIIGGVIVALAVFLITLPFGNTLARIEGIASSVETSLELIVDVTNVDPADISNVSGAIASGTEAVTSTVGDGTAGAINSIGEALQQFKLAPNDTAK